jgi:2-aminoethylphosphonate-pyruvate transaminase
VKQYFPDSNYIVDSMSGFGAIPLNIKNGQIDYLVSSSNKCIQGVPGFAFVVANKNKLLKCAGNSTSLSLDLYDQYINLEKTNQFRFTPPIHAILAFDEALQELKDEGGVSARFKRYSNNQKIAKDGLKKLGFKQLVPDDEQGPIINSFFYPNDKNFDFNKFYNHLSDRGNFSNFQIHLLLFRLNSNLLLMKV